VENNFSFHQKNVLGKNIIGKENQREKLEMYFTYDIIFVLKNSFLWNFIGGDQITHVPS
jgi:hypothetical protein